MGDIRDIFTAAWSKVLKKATRNWQMLDSRWSSWFIDCAAVNELQLGSTVTQRSDTAATEALLPLVPRFLA